MPIRRNVIRVLPNPWTFIHPELGPQGACHMDTSGRHGPAKFLGAARDVRSEELRPLDVRGDRQRLAFRFPSMNAALTDGEPFELPRSPYYLDRLRDGDLVPADEQTRTQNDCRFASLAEAREAGIAAFEAEHGEGTFAEAFPEFAGSSTPALAEFGEGRAMPALATRGEQRIDPRRPGIEPDRARDVPPGGFDPDNLDARKGGQP